MINIITFFRRSGVIHEDIMEELSTTTGGTMPAQEIDMIGPIFALALILVVILLNWDFDTMYPSKEACLMELQALFHQDLPNGESVQERENPQEEEPFDF